MGTAFEKVIDSIKKEIKDTPYFLKRDIDKVWEGISYSDLDYDDFSDASLHLMALGVFRSDKKMLDRWFDYFHFEKSILHDPLCITSLLDENGLLVTNADDENCLKLK